MSPPQLIPSGLTAIHICIVEDDPPNADLIAHCCRSAADGLPVVLVKCGSVQEALVELVQHQFTLITLDMFLTTVSGTMALSIIHGYAPLTPIVICSGAIVELTSLTAYGVRAVVQKPFDVAEFVTLIRSILAERQLPPLEGQDFDSLALTGRGVLSTRLLYTMFLNAPEALLVSDGQIILGVNRQVPLLFGYHVSELLGQPIDMLLPTAQRQAHVEMRQAYLDQPRQRSGLEVLGQHKQGHVFPVRVTLAPVMELVGLRVIVMIQRVETPAP